MSVEANVLHRVHRNNANALRVVARHLAIPPRTRASDAWAVASLAFTVLLLNSNAYAAVPFAFGMLLCAKCCSLRLRAEQSANVQNALDVLESLDMDSTAALCKLEATSANVA